MKQGRPGLGTVNLAHRSWEQIILFVIGPSLLAPPWAPWLARCPGGDPRFTWHQGSERAHPEVPGAASLFLSLPDSPLFPGTFLLMWARSGFQPRSPSPPVPARRPQLSAAPPGPRPPLALDGHSWAVADAQKVGDRGPGNFLQQKLACLTFKPSTYPMPA